jgi:predicted metal-dependent peptidase
MAESTVIDKEKVVTVTDPKTDAAAREKLTTARIGLLLKAPFFGQLATRMTLTNADEWCGTAATDGRKFYYNSEFVNKMPLKQLEFLVGHEILHAVYDHMGRRGDRQPRLSNIAADYCVNQDLVEQRIGEKISVVPILFDSKFKGQSYEEVYDYLYQNADKIDISQLEKMVLDEHLEDGEGDGDADDGDGNGRGNGRPKLSKEERDAIRDEIKGAVIAAAQAAGAGNLPAGVKRLLKDITAPVIGWKELLQQQITAVIKNDYTWARPSRRGWHMDAILPGLKPGDMIDICIAMDQSGSISEADSRAFLSEIKGIMEAFDEYKITLWCFDTEIYNVQTFTSDNIDDIMTYEPMGGGGTDFMANWEFMKENNIEPKKFIMFTDGMPFDSWGEEEYCETVWIIKGNPGCEPPWGIWAHYEEAAKGGR